MVGSHADEVEGGEAVVRSRCEAMAEAVHAELTRYRAAQERELAELLSTQTRTEAAEQRTRHLQRVLSQPLRLLPQAVAVSAKTGQGFDQLRQVILDAAFDKEAFPTFGSRQPGTYGVIHRKLLRCHNTESSVGWEEMQQSAAAQSELESSQLVVRLVSSKLSSEPDVDEIQAVAEPEPEQDRHTESAGQLSVVGTLQCEIESWFSKFEDKRVKLSRAGVLTLEGTEPIDLCKAGTRVGQPKKPRAGRPFCVRIDCVDPVRKFVLDTGSAEQQQRWLAELRAAAGVAAAQATDYREYTFGLCVEDEELKRFTIRYRSASAVHKQLQGAGVVSGLTFPSSVFDAAKDFTHTEENWRRRGVEMERYFTALVQRHDVVSHAVFKANFDFDFAELVERHSRVATKVRNDPKLLRRAMAFLGITGEVLRPVYEHAPVLAERVFLRPQWLVDVMKELVHHDLHTAVEKIGAGKTSDSVPVKELGQLFCNKGVLDRRLLDWLWRDLPFPLTQSESEVSFVLELLTQLGLLTLLPQQEDPVWLLPLRLPPKDLKATASVAMAQAKFSAFLSRMGAASVLHGMENIAVLSLKDALAYITGADAVPQDAVDLAYQFADDLLLAGPDENGLTRDEIAVVNLYTQNAIYRSLNRALWSGERDACKPYWSFIRLLTQALFKIPKTSAGAVYRAIKNPYEPITEQDMLAKATESCPAFPDGGSGEPIVWWGFSSCTSNLQAAKGFLGKKETDRNVLYSIEGGSSARNVCKYSHYQGNDGAQDEDEVLMPFGSAFTVVTAAETSKNFLQVTLRQTHTFVYGGGHANNSGSELAVPPSPAQDATLARFAHKLSTIAVDEVGRGYEFHQPLPSGLMAVAISACAKLCGKHTSIWRQAISTIATDRASGVQLELSMFQSGLSRIDFTARCTAGSHHDLCLQKLKGFEIELVGVLSERWQGCTYTELCLVPGSQLEGVRMTTCRQAVERGEVVTSVGGSEISLASLLGSEGVSPLDAETQTMATTLQFFRAMAIGLASEFGTTSMCRRFCADLDSELDRQLGGTFAEGCCWSARLQQGSGCSIAAAGEDLAQAEAAVVVDGKSRACALLGAFGRLYERSHRLLAGSEQLSSIHDVLASLLSPFEWVRPTLLQLAETHHLRDVEAPEVSKAFAVLAAVPEGVPPQLQQPQGEAEEPEPEPES